MLNFLKVRPTPDRLSAACVLEHGGAQPARPPRSHLLLRRILLRSRKSAKVGGTEQNHATAKPGPHLYIWNARWEENIFILMFSLLT